ncbi:hypothetical protein [Novosphingobium sp. TH158]|uniref:hypothetical protein n=1 Tax=Novosphingobium sp. TH158 TaxID=2067455 RepID=UPI000C7E5FEC|nr:hypothetical protein [Novosphingobium sp. TH158]PLK25848.1 hypothetical protein C0V78_02295 [Novosphingobium sp. TH158]
MFAKFRHSGLLSRGAIALALAAATAGAALPAHAAKKEKEAAAPAGPKLLMSKPYMAKAQELNKALEAARTKPEFTAARQKLVAAFNAVGAARGEKARKAAVEQRDAVVTELKGVLAAEIAQFDAVRALEASPDDKYVSGQFYVQLGKWVYDLNWLRMGYEAQINSGKALAADLPTFEFEAANACYDIPDWPCAQKHYANAIALGKRDGNVELLHADTYFRQNQFAEGTDMVLKAVASRKAANLPIGPEWYAQGLNPVFRAKMLPQATALSAGLVSDFPSATNWSSAIRVQRYLGGLQGQDMMDLLRLLKRTGAFEDGNEYVEFVELGDKLRYPPEVLEVLDLGSKAGKLNVESDISLKEIKASAVLHDKEDRAGIAGMETRAKSATATPAAVNAAADVMLTYGQAAKAEELYNLALAKPGLDRDRILTRLGIAQIDQGKFAEAQATFAKVGGVRTNLAKLWSIYAAQKAKGG